MDEKIKYKLNKIKEFERELINLMVEGTKDMKGLKYLPNLNAIGGFDNENRAGLISIYSDHLNSFEIVRLLKEKGIRVHVRKDDHYSGTILKPLGLSSCVRVSICHYNTKEEVLHFLAAMNEICLKT